MVINTNGYQYKWLSHHDNNDDEDCNPTTTSLLSKSQIQDKRRASNVLDLEDLELLGIYLCLIGTYDVGHRDVVSC